MDAARGDTFMHEPSVELRDLVRRGYRFALSLTHEAARAEDLVQEAWFAVLQAGGPWTSAYLFAAIRNRFVDHCRRERRAAFESLTERHAQEIADEAAETRAALEDALDDGPWRVSNGELGAALARLRPEERAVLYLAAVEEYSARQIGELFDWPRGTVLSLIHRARGKLRQIMEQQPERTA